MKTVRRDKLMRMVAAGKMEAKCEMRLTDDYQMDDANKFGKTDWLPARLKSRYDDFVYGSINFDDSDFKGKCGYAWDKGDGTFDLTIHSNLWYTLRPKPATS